MKIVREKLAEGAARAEGVVVVVDVIRAFTTAAFALAAPEGDDAVSDHLEALLRGEEPTTAETLRRVRRCEAAREILEGRRDHSPPQDVACCLAVDFFDFAIRVDPGPVPVARIEESRQAVRR